MNHSRPVIGVVLGTRPEIIKNWSIVQAARARGLPHFILYTNQHRDLLMGSALFDEFGYGADRVLDGDYALGRAIDWIRECIAELRIDLVLVNGDTAASLVGTLAALYSDIGIAHVEAGLRSYDPEMYEERNRIMVDAAAHYLFTYTDSEAQFLMKRPEMRGRIFNVGNTTVDVIDAFAARLARPREGRFAYVTLHRKELTDRYDEMVGVFRALAELSEDVEVIFPVHPRTRDAMQRYRIPPSVLGNVVVSEPLTAFASLSHIKYAAVVLTDSGCVQEEACILRTPCVTIRENTERSATIAVGANVLSGWRGERVIELARSQMARCDREWPTVYGAPGAGERIVAILSRDFQSFRSY
jgi:UDP-N-acetylglucosamine 2-epimerase